MMFFKKEFNELFTRLRAVEQKVEVNEEHDRNLEAMFIKHDKQEMEKYKDIASRLEQLHKERNIIIGGFLVFEYLLSKGMLPF